ncbi:MAG TPA: hypothetical protein VM364_17075 [Vicinamibacterales bacterium]|nr:hypothetical protein [Vicinamibacterales bacterium]
MTRGFRHTLLSAAIFALVVGGIAAVDPHVRERLSELAHGAAAPASWSDRTMNVVDAFGSAIRYQSIENAPLLIFATVGAVLFVFMVRT